MLGLSGPRCVTPNYGSKTRRVNRVCMDMAGMSIGLPGPCFRAAIQAPATEAGCMIAAPRWCERQHMPCRIARHRRVAGARKAEQGATAAVGTLIDDCRLYEPLYRLEWSAMPADASAHLTNPTPARVALVVCWSHATLGGGCDDMTHSERIVRCRTKHPRAGGRT